MKNNSGSMYAVMGAPEVKSSHQAYRPISRSPNRVKYQEPETSEIILKDKSEIKDMYRRAFAGIVVDRSKPSPKAITKLKSPSNQVSPATNKEAPREEYCVIYG